MAFLDRMMQLEQDGSPQLCTHAFKNDCLIADRPAAFEDAAANGEVTLVTKYPLQISGYWQEKEDTSIFQWIGEEDTIRWPDIYVSTLLLTEKKLDDIADHVLTGKGRAIFRCCHHLTEMGRIEAKYKYSPIMLLSRYGLLSGSVICGGIHLDKDDIDLMVQSQSRLVLCPTMDIGGGCGFPSLPLCLHRGLPVSLGTGDGRYNRSHSLLKEAEILWYVTNAQMHSEQALDPGALYQMICSTRGKQIWDITADRDGTESFFRLLFSERRKMDNSSKQED